MNTNHLPRRAILAEFPSSALFLCSEKKTHTNTITRPPWFWTSKCHGKLLAMAEKLLGMTFSCTKWKIKALKWLGFTDLNKLAHNINSAKTCFPLPEGLTRAKEKKNRINDWANKSWQLKKISLIDVFSLYVFFSHIECRPRDIFKRIFFLSFT